MRHDQRYNRTDLSILFYCGRNQFSNFTLIRKKINGFLEKKFEFDEYIIRNKDCRVGEEEEEEEEKRKEYNIIHLYSPECSCTQMALIYL